jgi:hypothetical protein
MTFSISQSLRPPSAGKVFPQPFIKVDDSACLLDDLVASDVVFYFDARHEFLDLTDLRKAADQFPIQFVAIQTHGNSNWTETACVNAPMVAD